MNAEENVFGKGGYDTVVKKNIMCAFAVISLLILPDLMVGQDSDQFLKVNKGIDVFGRVYREVASNYVDNIDPERFVEAGIEGMLGTLDPYTVYISKENGDEVDLLTNGRYGGIGVTIGLRDGAVKVLSVMEGYSAQRQGIQPGDTFLEINGVNVRGKKPDEIRSLTRGEPGSEVKVLVERDGEKAPTEFVLFREEIQLKNVTYADLIDKSIAYIRLERFSRKAGDEVRSAIKEMKLAGDLTGVILDLRGNPGGLLDAAVDVVSKFVPRGSLVVSTKGRRLEGEKKYLTTEEPLVPNVPLVVLTDRNSASASEIVAGSLQDLDRALIVGLRSFGKGLVQTIVPLEYGAQLKITTARYFIPSGRSIQEIDYVHKSKDGVFAITPDSLRREFHTLRGRKVVELGGITPDSVVELVDPGPMVRELNRKSLFFKFVTQYRAAHKADSLSGVTPAMIAAFKEFLKKENFDYQEETERKLSELKQLADRSHYSPEVLTDLAGLGSALEKERQRGFERYLGYIRNELNKELMAQLKGDHGRIGASLQEDVQVKAAVGLLGDKKMYTRKIGG
jgi:carboxyl-terminal processing protease